ncbi:TRAP transporter small permease subunit [uncultured Mailhella sp.]|uniref:TRAP transporter small permease n=1 Tax=uncultured Mailhella sp. TaxID=1981031 RepID=UPI0026380B28|nr:TRAP transporter small permease subunit [uncultured Mailhella sp.]
MGILKKIYDYFEEGMCCIMLSTMILCLSAQVLARMMVGTSIAWTEELSRYTFLWSVYLGAALAAKRGAHVRVTAQFLWMKDNLRMFFRVLADALWVCALLFIAFNCLPVLEEGFEFPEISPTMHFAKVWVECIIPLSFVMVAWRVVADYFIRWKNGTLNRLVRFEEDL